MPLFSSKYSVELRTPGGLLLADLSGRARNRRFTASRNEAEQIEWSLDLNEFERYCASTSQDPKSLIIAGQTEVRIKRLGTYLGGGRIEYALPHISATEQTLDLKASGFLNMFQDRFTGITPSGTVQETFAATEATTIASTLITQSQALANGDFGVTIGTLATVGPHDRTYQRTNLKNALQDLTRVQTHPFDFQFTADKVFNTYSRLGSNRPDLIFEFPGNIKDLSAPIDATGVANEVIALGAGFGSQAQAQFIPDDVGSQLQYKLRQHVLTTNAVDNSDNGLTDAANSYLAAWAYPFQIPGIVINGNVAPFITDYGIGDYVSIRVNGYQMLNQINGLYPIEKYQLVIDDEDNEEITIYASA